MLQHHLQFANTGNNVNAHVQKIESTLVHPFTAESNITVKNNEDELYSPIENDFQVLVNEKN